MAARARGRDRGRLRIAKGPGARCVPTLVLSARRRDRRTVSACWSLTMSKSSKSKNSSKQAVSWRDVLPVHEAAELVPMMSLDELRELGEERAQEPGDPSIG
jgi:hypothetical protein